MRTRTGRGLYRRLHSQTARVEERTKRRSFAERSGSFIGLMMLAGRLVERAGAFGQILLIAAVLGSTTRADLYFIASIVPLLIGNVVGEALAAVVLPRAAREDDATARDVFSAGLWIAAFVLGALTVVYLVAVAVFVPRTTPAGTASLLPWIAFAPVGFLFGLGTYCAAPLLHYERYVWPALRSATATIVGLVLTAVVVALGGGVVWIGLAVSTGYGVALVLLVLEIVSIGRGAIFAPPTRWALGEVTSLWRKLSASAASGVIGGQVFVLIERVLTAPLGVGAVASISYARGVAYTPAILGQAIAAGVYPSLLRAHAADAAEFVRGRFVSGLRLTLFVTAVSAAYLALFSTEIAEVLFGRDAVTEASLVAVQQSLVAFSLALLGWMLTIYASRLFGALNLFRGLVLQEVVALVVYLAIVFPLRNAPRRPRGRARVRDRPGHRRDRGDRLHRAAARHPAFGDRRQGRSPRSGTGRPGRSRARCGEGRARGWNRPAEPRRRRRRCDHGCRHRRCRPSGRLSGRSSIPCGASCAAGAAALQHPNNIRR